MYEKEYEYVMFFPFLFWYGFCLKIKENELSYIMFFL